MLSAMILKPAWVCMWQEDIQPSPNGFSLYDEAAEKAERNWLALSGL